MKTDLLLVPMDASYAQMREAARVAEASGFGGIWTWDHLRDPSRGPRGVPECLTTLAALAEAVPRVFLGPLVLNVASRHPGVLANAAATLQQVSGGRLLLGLGAGGSVHTPYAREQQALGRSVETDAGRRRQLEEAIEVLRRLWSGDASDFEGRYFQLRAPSGYLAPEPRPPILVGGFGPRMAALAGRLADGFNTQAFHPRLGELLAIARGEYEKRGGNPEEFAATVFAGFGSDWLDAQSAGRARLEALGVDRLILIVEPPYPLEALRRAAPALARLEA